MSIVTSHLSISLDGYTAGPNQSLQNPLGEGGERLHEWAVKTASWRAMHGESGGEASPDSDVAAEVSSGVGAYIMGRGMFGNGARYPGGGEWDESWRGWWGEEPPYHAPVFVLTHHPRGPLTMQGGTTFNFVTDGIESALTQARAAANGQTILIAGGAATVNQYLAAGLIDDLWLHIAPITLGSGERLFGGADVRLEPVDCRQTDLVTHVRYRILK